jgi:hypothetical protein
MECEAMMEFTRWNELGFDENEAAELSAARRGDDCFGLGRELGLWERWVTELERGTLWSRGELEAAWAARDELELTLREIVPDVDRDRLSPSIDALDRSFRDHTVSSGRASGNWWHGRIPISNRQRWYLLDE